MKSIENERLVHFSSGSTTGSQVLRSAKAPSYAELAIFLRILSRSTAIRVGMPFSSSSSMYDHVRLFTRVSGALASDLTLSLRQLARHLRIHPHTLAQVIREHTGTSFSAWRARHRLAAARGLLGSRPDLSIKEIAAAAGFSSTSVFDRCFRRAFGCPPSQCRLAQPSSFLSPDGSGVNLLDHSSTDDGAQRAPSSATLDSCTASS
jgi:AraC-like DNA-binding protein